MTWKEITVVDQRRRFVREVMNGVLSLSEQCRRFEISRPTGYKWLERYKNEGDAAFVGLSRARHTQNCATPIELEKEILDVKIKYPTWGPRKILAYLNLDKPDLCWPSKTTIGNILSRHGFVVKRKYRHRFAMLPTPISEVNKENGTWCLDFKGASMTADGKKCGPFTVTDAHSRYLLYCNHLEADNTENVWSVLKIMFQEYGLPAAVLSDNGPPFASKGPGRLSRLAVRLIKVGVMPGWIEPGKPYQNGRHERMHLTLALEAVDSNLTLKEQQKKFIEFQSYFNFVRPHEAIENQRPGDVYQPSLRRWDGKVDSPEYSEEFEVGGVRSCGKMCWRGISIYIGRALSNEPIGIKENDQGELEAYFGSYFLGVIVDDHLQFDRMKGRKEKHKKKEKN